jgi:signal transduction histidine kinase/HAMP domain-containing protein/DNA-binding response OmpR family regulator
MSPKVASLSGDSMKVVEDPQVAGAATELSALLSALDRLRKGDADVRLPLGWSGLPGKVAEAFNDVVERNAALAHELSRLRKAVGKEGRLKQRAALTHAPGFWGESVECINSLIDDLVHPTSEVARVIGAVAQGDLSKSMALEVDGRPLEGEFLRTAKTINKMVEQLGDFSAEVTRVAREVGTEGKLGGQATLRGVAGTWKDLTDSVNSMAGNLTAQVRNIADVTTAVAKGDLSKKIDVDVKGEFLTLKNTINTMVDQLRSFASEVTRVAREVGTEGSLGGQARVEGVSGTWKDLTESVNSMAGNLTSQVRNIADVTKAVAAGDLSKKITVDVKGEILELKNTINTMVDQLRSFAAEVTRVAREVGTEGKLGGQADVQGVAGTWKDLTESVNLMASNLTVQLRDVSKVATAIAGGDLTRKITVDVRGEILQIKDVINTMVDQLSSFAAEVTRVAREVGTEGRLGGQAQVKGVSGTWKDLTDNVNSMAGNLTGQVRGIAKVVTAVANGDLKRKLTVEAKGEIAALADTINSMTDTLATFADQVTTVAREVGVEGKLGGQAKVPGAAGTWKALTENVNELAANLTTQVRAIAEVATAVTQGDLTRSITVETQGEVAALKDTINEMIRNLRDTTQKNTEQDWLKTNLAKFSRMLQGQKDLVTVGQLILSELAPVVGAQQAEFYVMKSPAGLPSLELFASYASGGQHTHGKRVVLGEGLVGQCALDKSKILLTNVPSSAFRVASGLSESAAMDVLVLPVIFEGQVRGVLELASLERFNPAHQAFLDQLTESIGIVINTIEANSRTEDLLKQSQSLAQELQSRQQELQQTNQELQEKARLLAHQNQEVERKNSEVEQARQALEEKAEQLALTSKYKSEFLANMSHELRTPLNSLLILSDQLCKNSEGNLSMKQVEFAKTIHASGNDLLMLINDILDLSKIESGTVVVDASELRFDDLKRSVERSFRYFAESKQIGFAIRLDTPLPKAMTTDVKRLQQIIKNLLSNAFKFTHQGRVELSIAEADGGWSPDNEELERADRVIAFSVSDTGIGISPDKQQIIFEAFQQADGSTSRKYGGTGLGLAISRELSRLLGGEIRLVSAPGKGSTFTLYLPQIYVPGRSARHARPAVADAVPAPASVAPAVAEADVVAEASDAPVNVADDDRDDIESGDRVLLVVENDLAFARMLLEAGRRAGFKGLVATTGVAALSLARDMAPSAVTLDIHLPDMQGWRILNRLKGSADTRHVPVCVVSTDDARERALQGGAAGFLAKPLQSADLIDEAVARLRRHVDRSPRRLLVALPDGELRDRFLAALGAGVDTAVVDNAAQARELLNDVDGIVIDPKLDLLDPDDVDEAVERRATPLPVVVHAPDALPPTWRRRPSGFVRWDAHSFDTLLGHTAFCLHREPAMLSDAERGALDALHGVRRTMAGRKALIVDDDMRNIFALATVLADEGIVTVSANDGREAIRLVEHDPSIDIVLMDIMMPEMDGIETMKAIRRLPQGRELPMVAVTAKAMKGDRQKCIEAGAWDYIAKPVDPTHLVNVLRSWLCI